MRRARISVKPNIRPGGRSVTGGEQPSQAPTDGAVTAEKAARPSPSPQQSPAKEGPAEAVGVENTPTSPSEKASTDLNNGAPSSGTTTTPAPVPQRRMRISVTPKLAGPKATSTPRLLPRVPRSVPPTLPKEAPPPIPIAESETLAPENLPELNISDPTTPSERARQSSTTHTPPSPCLPSTSSTSDLCKPPAHEKKSSVEDSPPSPQPGQVPQQPPREAEPQKYPTSGSDMPSPDGNLSCCDVPGSPQKGNAGESDRERILRALKLKELMKIERRKDIKKEKRGSRRKPECIPTDRSKMTMGDLIYYLPNTSPMRHSTVCEGTEEEVVVPPSPKVPENKKTPEWEDEEEEEEEEEGKDEGMLMPKVRVAEDGSIILDEESLTVRVQRTSTTKVVENSSTLFEQGCTTTYRSFRNWTHVKSWSVRETDMFYLAISMVGTDFSLIGLLLPHRSRAEIKNKFKKEERTNSWRIDKAFKNKRPYDREFFSFLLEKVLAKDKEKGKSVKLVMKTPKKRRKAKGKKAADNEEQCISVSGDDEDFDMEDGEHIEAEKENEGHPNVNDADVSGPAKKKRKRTRTVSESKDKEDCCEEQQDNKKTKKSKGTKKSKKEMPSPEGGSVGDDSVNADKENEPDSSAPALKKKRKRAKKPEEEQQDGASVEGSKSKRSKKSLKVNDNLEDSTGANAESSIADDADSVATKKKRRRSQKTDLKEDMPAVEKSCSTKRKKSQKVTNEGPAEDGEATVATEDGEATVATEDGEATVVTEDGEATVAMKDGEVSETKKMDTIISAKEKDKAPKRSAKQPKKPTPNLAKRRVLKPSEPETTAKADEEGQESQNEENIEVIVERESRALDMDKLQKQVVVPLEKTPPRMINLSSPSKVRHKSNEESEDPPAPPAPDAESSSGQQLRKQRAERVKRSLTTEKKKGKRKAVKDQDEPEHDPGASAEDMRSPTDLLEEMVNQRSEETEDESLLDENLIDFSCLHHLNSPIFQRKPMVVLSREDVSMILNVEEPTDEEDPSVSPLDLSLNTELSFPLQCSNLLMEENAEAAQVESGVGEHEDAPQETPLCSFVLEEKQYEDLGLGELLSSWPGISTTAKIPSLASDDVPTSAKDLKGCPDVAALETMPSKHSVYTESEAPVPLEAVKQGASLAHQGTVVESNTCMIETPKIKEGSQESVVATSEVMIKSQGTIMVTSGIKEGYQDSAFAASKVIMRSQGSVTVTPGIKEGSQESVVATSGVLTRSQGSVTVTPEIKEGSQESVVATSGVLTRSKLSTLIKLEIKEGSQESVLATSEALTRPQGSTLETPEIKEGSQKSALATSEALMGSKDSKTEIPEIKHGSQESALASSEVLTRSQRSIKVTQAIKEGSQESVFQGSTLETPEIKEGSQESALATSKALMGSKDSKPEIPEIKHGSQESALASSEVLTRLRSSIKVTQAIKEGSQESGFQGSTLETPEIKESSQQSVVESMDIKDSIKELQASSLATSQGSIVATPAIKTISEESPVAAILGTESPQEEIKQAIKPSASSSSGLGASLKRSRFSKPKPNLFAATSKIRHSSPKQPTKPEHQKMSSEKISPHSSDMDCDVDDLSKKMFSKEQEKKAQSCFVNLESGTEEGPFSALDSTPSEGSIVCSGKQAIDVSASSAKKTHLPAEETCDVDRRASCAPEAEDLQKWVDKSCSCPLSTESAEQETPGQMVDNPEEICTPAKLIQPSECGNSEEEPTFILTLYEIPVTEAYPASATNNDTAMIPSALPSEPGGELAQPTMTQDKPQQTVRPQVKNEAGEDVSDVPNAESKVENKEDPEMVPLETETEDTLDVPKTKSKSESEDDPGLAPLEGMEPRYQSTPFPVTVSKCITPRTQDDTTQCEDVSKDDASYEEPIKEQKANIPRASRSTAVISDGKTTLPVKRRAKLQVKPSLVERKSAKKECPKPPQTTSSAPQEAELKTDAETSARRVHGDTTVKCDVESNANVNESSLPTAHNVANVQPGHEDNEDMALSVMPTTSASCFASLESEAAEEEDCEGVSHTVLADFFVPVSEEMGHDLSQDWEVPAESRPHEETLSLPTMSDVQSKKTEKQSQQAELSSPPSTPSRKKSVLKETKPKEKESPARNKGGKLMVKIPFTKQELKKTKSSESHPPESEDCGLKHPQTAPGMRQLRITSWVKQSDQAGTKLEVLDLSKTSRIETPSLRTKDGSKVVPSKNEDLKARTQPLVSMQKEKTCGVVSDTVLLPASEDTPGVPSTFTAKPSKEEPSVSQTNKPPVTRRAKLQVKPTIPKTRTRAKDKGDSSDSDQTKSSQPPTSLIRQRTRAAAFKKEFDETSKKSTEDVSQTSRKHHKGSLLKSEVPASEAGVSLGSSPPTSSPVRVSTRTSPPETSQQLKTSPSIPPKEGSPKSSDDTEDEPSRVSQFFLCDIFTEVEDGD